MLIETSEDWWTLVNAHWGRLLDIFAKVDAPLGRAEQDYWWSDGIGQDATRHDRPLIEVLETAKTMRDHETLHRFFELAWLAAPDTPHIHRWLAWDIICDLCSENWVFYPKDKLLL